MRTVREALEAQGDLKPNVVGAEVGGELLDLFTPVPDDAASLKPVTAESDAALPIIRHSTAHVMASAVQRLFPGTQVTFGPATDSGFYYDFDRPEGAFSEDELRVIEEEMLRIIESQAEFEREVLPKDEVRKLLESMGERYKVEHLERLEDPISVYRVGGWVDLCKGPHVPSTQYLKAFKLTSVAGAYWRGDERNPMLHRIYGTAFASPKALRAHLKQLEEAKARDHRKLGKELNLFTFHETAPASPIFLPRGAQVYRGLVEYIRELYLRYGYEELITPQVFDRKLFETSGHLPSYASSMFFAAADDGAEQADSKEARFCLKPMNCPAHAALFGTRRRSYRELPWRVADFGRLHRYERSGVVQGLTRVRTFCQDDGHIFCAEDQVQDEITAFIDLVGEVYREFGFQDPKIYIATRPDERIGADEVWDRSEQALIAGVEARNLPYEIAEGEGAFYGPKVEFHLKDAIGRSWQLGTIQADFNLPQRFDLKYVGADNETHRPVMLHRAILGSVERFFGVLVEHTAGKFPAWLAPEQLIVASVSEANAAYAEEAAATLRAAGFRVYADVSDGKLGAKIRQARLLRVPYIAVVGDAEAEAGTLTLRAGNDTLGTKTLEEARDFLREACTRRVPSTENLAV